MPHTSTSALLALDNVSCQRGNEWLFRNISLSIEPGSTVWLRGQNGTGKTSLLRIAVGLSKPHAGSVARSQPRCVYLAHANGLKDNLTLRESLDFLARLHGCTEAESMLSEAMKNLGVLHRRNIPTKALSQGQKRRAALARLALEDKPGLWVLDEPYDALDQAGIAAVDALIAANAHRGGSTLLTSHLPLSTHISNPIVFDLDWHKTQGSTT